MWCKHGLTTLLHAKDDINGSWIPSSDRTKLLQALAFHPVRNESVIFRFDCIKTCLRPGGCLSFDLTGTLGCISLGKSKSTQQIYPSNHGLWKELMSPLWARIARFRSDCQLSQRNTPLSPLLKIVKEWTLGMNFSSCLCMLPEMSFLVPVIKTSKMEASLEKLLQDDGSYFLLFRNNYRRRKR